jgi:hypothetical protein
VARIILLDSGPLGTATGPPGRPHVIRCQAWLAALETAGADILIPEIADYEIRRELIRAGATAGLKRLDALQIRCSYLEINTTAMRHAATLWATVRNLGVPTAGPQDLDADAILAGQAMTVAQPGDVVKIATSNPRHLVRFPGVDAEQWDQILP